MSDHAFRVMMIFVAAYVVMIVLCFGPATVQSERAREQHLAECRAVHEGDRDRQALCGASGPMVSDGLPKAMFWPLWLSYTAAASR